MYVIDRMIDQAKEDFSPTKLKSLAEEICLQDQDLCEQIANHGSELISEGDHVITHCNTGGLATAGLGTALGVLIKSHQQNKNIHVYVDETRPLLQGARLTTWELEKHGVPYTLICDNMAATLMKSGKINKAIVGADRIATNGDFANKIGTYSLALLSKHHNIPFYVAAPSTTLDKNCNSGEGIEIEQRNPSEVRGGHGHFGSVRWAPRNAATFNPAFDVTEADLVSAWVLDSGIYQEPNFL
jgi:methylthioribose-1-phosphate isomerase